MALDEFIEIVITTETKSVSRKGFGIPMIAAYTTAFTERYRKFSDAAEMLEGSLFSEDDVAYRAAVSIESQNPKPEYFLVGRLDTAPVQIIELTLSTVATGTKYSGTINGYAWSFTSVDAVLANILAGIEAAIGTANLGASVTTDDTSGTKLVITSTDSDKLFTFSADRTLMAQQNVSTASAATIVTELGAIEAATSDFYAVILTTLGPTEIQAAAGHVETKELICLAGSADADLLTAATTDVMEAATVGLKTKGYNRTMLLYSEDAYNTYAHGGWAARLLPQDPGSTNWAYKDIVGSAVSSLSSTEQGYLEGKNANWFQLKGGARVTFEGKMASGEYVDIIRGRDWLKVRMQERIFSQLANVEKIPFTDAGIALIESEVRAQLQEGIRQGFLAASPAPTVSVPLAEDVDDASKIARILPDVSFQATLSGAINKIKPINGRISV